MHVSVIVVNYAVADYVRGCVASLLEQDVGRGPGADVEVIVVDNFSSRDERERVRALERPGVRVVCLDDNAGYAAAISRGLEHASADRFCFLNPDVRVLPAALAAMCRLLDGSPAIGGVAPISWFDDERTVMHPPHLLPSLRELAWSAAAARSPAARRALDRRRFAFRLRYWLASEPIALPMLTGSCIATTRGALARAGGMDPAYPLYFEDADWCRRVSRAGLTLLVEPRAEIVHYYSVSAGRHRAAAEAKHAVSRDLYFRKLGGRLGLALSRRLERAAAHADASREREAFEDLGDLAAPPTVATSGASDSPALVEIAGEPMFDLPAGAIVRSTTFTLSPTTWRHLVPAEYFVREVDPRTLDVRSRWRFRKAPTASG